MKKRLMTLAAFAFLSVFANAALADGTVRLVVPFPAGSITDIAARLVAPRLSDQLKQPVIIDNRTGAYGMIAARDVAVSKPDGLTLGFSPDGPLATLPASCIAHGQKLLYDPTTFSTIGFVGRTYFELVVRKDLPFDTLGQLIEYARKNPGKLNFGSGTPSAILGDGILNSIEGVKVTEIPAGRGGEPQVILDIMSGTVDALFSTTYSAMPYLENGALKSLGTVGSVRNPFLPRSITLAEQGYPAFAEAEVWFALVGPPGLPAKEIERLNTALNKALDDNELKDQLAKSRVTLYSTSPAAPAAQIKKQIEFTAKLIREHDLKVPCGS
ncbi:tripartite tricarboxylate transporter substrate binding protein [Candidatus Kaiserbacteria bacterium]|nr:tripartite tricarboxylate transporter substrate binding protein [Candidatus Kaiserbacteria bacterium]